MKLTSKAVLFLISLVAANRLAFWGFDLINANSDTLPMLGIILVVVSILGPIYLGFKLFYPNKEKHTHENQSSSSGSTGGAGTF